MHQSVIQENFIFIAGGFDGITMKNDIFKMKIEDLFLNAIPTETSNQTSKTSTNLYNNNSNNNVMGSRNSQPNMQYKENDDRDDLNSEINDVEDSFIHINQFSEW
jgi:hypothetical protein